MTAPTASPACAEEGLEWTLREEKHQRHLSGLRALGHRSHHRPSAADPGGPTESEVSSF